MSYDLAVWADPQGRYRDAPQARYEALCDLNDGDEPSARLAEFVSELQRRWPGETDEELERSPWASWPLTGQATQSGVVLNFTYSTGADVLQQIIDLAHSRDLAVYDPQAGEFYTKPSAASRVRESVSTVAERAVRLRIVRAVIIFAFVAGLMLLLSRCS